MLSQCHLFLFLLNSNLTSNLKDVLKGRISSEASRDECVDICDL